MMNRGSIHVYELRQEFMHNRLVLWDLPALGDALGVQGMNLLERLLEASMVDGTFVQIAPVALPTAQGTVRGTVITVVYALDSLGNVWKLMDHLGQKWMRVTAEREG
jgi:hypothetical protein